MTEPSFSERWDETAKRRAENTSHLINVGVLDPVDPKMPRDQIVVGTRYESMEIQRNGMRFSAPTSRQALLDSFKPK